MRTSRSIVMALLVFFAIFSISTSSIRSFADIVNSQPAGFNPDLTGLGSYSDALQNVGSYNKGIDAINKAACQAEGQSKKEEEKKCEKDKISKPSEPWETKDSLPEFKKYEELKQTGSKEAKKPIDVCGYNEGCKEVDKKFKDYYDPCLKKCEQVKTKVVTIPMPPPNEPMVIVTSISTGDSGKTYIDTKQGPQSMQAALEQQTKEKAIKDCKGPQGEQKHCTKKSGDKANEDGKKETEKNQECGKKPQGNTMTTDQQEDCLKIIQKKCECNEVSKVATSDTIGKISTSNTGLVLGLTTKCPSVDGMKCGPWDKCDKSTISENNCGMGYSVDKILDSKGSACSENSGTHQLKATNYGNAEICGGSPSCS